MCLSIKCSEVYWNTGSDLNAWTKITGKYIKNSTWTQIICIWEKANKNGTTVTSLICYLMCTLKIYVIQVSIYADKNDTTDRWPVWWQIKLKVGHNLRLVVTTHTVVCTKRCRKTAMMWSYLYVNKLMLKKKSGY